MEQHNQRSGTSQKTTGARKSAAKRGTKPQNTKSKTARSAKKTNNQAERNSRTWQAPELELIPVGQHSHAGQPYAGAGRRVSNTLPHTGTGVHTHIPSTHQHIGANTHAHSTSSHHNPPHRYPPRRHGFPALLKLALAFCLALFIWHFIPKTQETPVTVDAASFSPATVLYVLDANRVVVLTDGGQETVRLLGSTAPQSVRADGKPDKKGQQAALFLDEILKKGSTVYLQTDAADRDKDLNLLRYVWTSMPQQTISLSDLKQNTAEGQLLHNRHAKPSSDESAVMYQRFWKKMR